MYVPGAVNFTSVKKILHVVTAPQTLNFLSGQAGFLRPHGFEVSAVSSPGAGLSAFGQRESVPVHAVPMTRSISPLRDVVALGRLVRLFRRERPAIVHAHTPKAGLLAMTAACLSGVRRRIFHLHGLPHSTAKGLPRLLLALSTRVSCLLATDVLCVSESARAAAIAEGLVNESAIRVPSPGGINGVDARNQFCPSGKRSDLRAGIPQDAVVIGFAGRLVRDKGILELITAWNRLRMEFPHAHLLIAGEAELRDAVPPAAIAALRADERVRVLGQVADMPDFYSAIDLLVLPSYREGLPTVALEAAAMQLPVVTTNAVGCVDAVQDGVTGAVVRVGDCAGLEQALQRYLQHADLREQHGRQAREHALRHWNPENVWQALLEEYQGMHVTPISKRVPDVILAALALIALSPILLALAGAIRWRMGSPVLFRQTRPGMNERVFTMYKFRSMRDAVDRNGKPPPDHERLTRFGRLLRSTSLDELPELWNVLKGDMSLVGPRPLLVEYLTRYTPFQRRRHEVKPGITGWAQVNGRNSLSWEEKFEMDVWYVENRSLTLDLKILWLTFRTLVRRDGISQQGHATMSEFLGGPEYLRTPQTGS
jgi:lipopolysaccharide/colanic/teichoic acid biosynthesis glycosyltransferase